jgi:hypothetical protein
LGAERGVEVVLFFGDVEDAGLAPVGLVAFDRFEFVEDVAGGPLTVEAGLGDAAA